MSAPASRQLPDYRIIYNWDGEVLDSEQVVPSRLENPSPPGGTFQPQPRWREISTVSSAAWLEWDLTSREIEPGRHGVHVVLIERHPQLLAPITLTDVELVVCY
ncbi:MAG: hypothetical protein VYC64_18990 [Candidatus Latescibacterota bacterium]|nr:hypothetical protein [Candidatus Latescibacterota bacterium]